MGKPADYGDYVFVNFASEDKEFAKKITTDLNVKLAPYGKSSWSATGDLLPGQNWGSEISKRIRYASNFIQVVSAKAVEKRGYVQKELKKAKEVGEGKLAEDNFIIPVNIDGCEYTDEDGEETGVISIYRNYEAGLAAVVNRILKGAKIYISFPPGYEDLADAMEDILTLRGFVVKKREAGMSSDAIKAAIRTSQAALVFQSPQTERVRGVHITEANVLRDDLLDEMPDNAIGIIPILLEKFPKGSHRSFSGLQPLDFTDRDWSELLNRLNRSFRTGGLLTENEELCLPQEANNVSDDEKAAVELTKRQVRLEKEIADLRNQLAAKEAELEEAERLILELGEKMSSPATKLFAFVPEKLRSGTWKDEKSFSDWYARVKKSTESGKWYEVIESNYIIELFQLAKNWSEFMAFEYRDGKFYFKTKK